MNNDIELLDLKRRLAEEQLAHLKVSMKLEELERENKRLRHIAFHDPLTGLLNRAGLKDGVILPQEIAIIYLDGDKVKAMNDTFGHEWGDSLLRMFAWHLQSSVRGEDLVARIGGDEFVIVLPQAGREAAEAVTERLRESLDRLNGDAISMSRGIVAGYVKDWPDFERLLKEGDEAAYTDKRNRKVSRTHLEA